MSHISITSSSNSIEIVYNDAGSHSGIAKQCLRIENINAIALEKNEEFVQVFCRNGDFKLSFEDADDLMGVDTVDGTALTDNSHLYDLISGLIT